MGKGVQKDKCSASPRREIRKLFQFPRGIRVRWVESEDFFDFPARVLEVAERAVVAGESYVSGSVVGRHGNGFAVEALSHRVLSASLILISDQAE
jgi:hypothetical protein